MKVWSLKTGSNTATNVLNMRKQFPILQGVTFAILYLVRMTGIDYLQGEHINFDLIQKHIFVGIMVGVLMYYGVFKRQAEKRDTEE